MSNSFFGKNGTINQAMNMAGMLQGAKSDNAKSRFGALSGLVKLVMSLF